MSRRTFLVGSVLSVFIATTALALFSTSDTFWFRRSSPAAGGAETASASYRLTSLGGQTAIGRTDSDSYGVDHGYFSQALSALSAVDDKTLPVTYRLGAAFPNPANPSTTIQYDLPRPCHAVLEVFDIKGRLVRTLVDDDLDAGRHQVVWNGRDRAGFGVASGLYFVKMHAGDYAGAQKITLLK